MARLVAAAAVRARLARAFAGETTDDDSVGQFRLRPDQREAVRAIRVALASDGGALLADPPGTGKTVVALAVARDFDDTLLLAPAALRAQWAGAAARAGVPIRFVSHEALSRGADPPPAPLVIIDEAHHLRTPGTRRYARAAALTSGARILLLTATPVVNRRGDRDALLALICGGRAAELDGQTLARIVIRREAQRADLPIVRRAPLLAVPFSPPGIGEAIAALPPPFPAADGAAALALIRITLAMSWCSSLAALDALLRRRVQRGEALADALRAGRWPTRAALRQWVVSDDSTQLAFPALTVPEERAAPAEALSSLRAHLDAVAQLRTIVAPGIAADTAARAIMLRRLCDAHPSERVVVLARHADTIRALWSALRGDPGVVAITGERVRAAQGRWTRDEILAALGPKARPWRADDRRGIRVLLATDLLSEGVELQGVGILVHGDGAWTPARLEQRVGRVARVGALRDEVLVTRFAAPSQARPLVQLERRLRAKDRARERAIAVARAAEEVDTRLRRWHTPLPPERVPPERIAAVCASLRGFLAAVRIGEKTHFLAGRKAKGRWRVSLSPLALKRLISQAEGTPIAADRDEVAEARRVLRRWARNQAGDAEAGRPLGADAALWRRARALTDRAIAGAALGARPELAQRVGVAFERLLRSAGAGTMRTLRKLLRERSDPVRFAEELIALGGRVGRDSWDTGDTGDTGETGGSGDSGDSGDSPDAERPRLVALLLLSASRCAPPEASPKNAAPRRSARARSPSCPRCPEDAAAATPLPCPAQEIGPTGARSGA